ncbi:MAG: aminoglycoside phosphotransferase family protein [Lachnospiraceae bacterium]|nr:aminoglycoside phosphotransferase family protein [Lachnospiraceae bacterium]
MTVNQMALVRHFQIESDVLSIKPYGRGHINHTFLVTTTGACRYILQKINNTVFPDTAALMDNIVNVTSYLREKINAGGGDPQRETLTVIMTKEQQAYYTDAEGNDWRMYLFIEDAETIEQTTDPEVFGQSGYVCGRFQAMLADYPAQQLHEILPDFHNTAKRYEDFIRAAEEDVCHRSAGVKREIAFLKERKEEMKTLGKLLQQGELPLRVTHNDTKLNNVVFDRTTHSALGLIDLDTVMPGLAEYDFGDAIRFGANTAAEDEKDTDRVSLSLELYHAYTEGFLKGCGGQLTRRELEMLPMGAKIMTLECGMRFLADYLQGDIYFKTAYAEHNLVRCRTQLALVADMERKWQQMCETVR